MNETTLSLIPDRAEKKLIRSYYNKAGSTIFLFTFLYFAAQIVFAFIDTSAVNPTLMQGIGVVITLSIEIIAIIGGCHFTGLELKDFFINREGYNGVTIFKTWITTQGLGYLGIILGLAFVIIINLTGGSTNVPIPTQGDSAGATVIVTMFAIFGAPIIEEILCRGLVLNGLKKYNTPLALVVSAFIFGFLHGNAFQFAYATIMGFVLGVVALKSKSIIPTIFAHMSVNLTACTIQVISSAAGLTEFQSDIDLTDFDSLMAASMDIPPVITLVSNLIALFAVSIVIAAVIIAVLHIKKFRTYCPKSTPLGKTRGLPVFITSPVWIIIFVYYIVSVFVFPFLFAPTA
jgi:membrane protease YdiL (CAAX protease family)